MPTTDSAITLDSEALDWAASHLSFDERRLTHQTPWARVYSLNGASNGELNEPSGRASLRLAPPRLVPKLKGVVGLARHFPDFVPAVIAHDEAMADGQGGA